jgi:hypothetical protein
MKKSYIVFLFIAASLMLLSTVQATATTIISNIYESQTAVVPNQSLSVSPDNGSSGISTIPKETYVGTPVQVGIDVKNPNNVAIIANFMLNITRLGITSNDVTVYDPAPNQQVIVEGPYSDQTLVFLIEMNDGLGFTLYPGQAKNVTTIYVEYYIAGDYIYDLAITS